MATEADLPLPKGYTSVDDILEGKRRTGSLVDVVGLVSDFRQPTPTRGKDWKAQIILYDVSVQWDTERFLEMNIFRQEHEMPAPNLGDVIIIHQAKIQVHRSDLPSLLTSHATQLFIFAADNIPRPPQSAADALCPPTQKMAKPAISPQVYSFVSRLYHQIDKERLPSPTEFEAFKIKSVNIRDKFKKLKDLKDGIFADLVGQVAREPYDTGDKITLWVTDYTEHPELFNRAFPGGEGSGFGGDPYGYGVKDMQLSQSAWAGPFGKRSLQVTCWEPHATAIRTCGIKSGSWASLQNVQIRFGSNGANLEGNLREDRGFGGNRLRISLLDPQTDPENIDARLKEAIRQKLDYEKKKKSELKELNAAAKAGEKRRANLGLDAALAPSKENSKKRRKLERAKRQAEKLKRVEEEEVEISTLSVDLNPQVRSENENRTTSFVAQVLQPVHFETSIEGQTIKLELPFTNLNYRTRVRVVDFEPASLAKFARVSSAPKEREYACLSDYSGEDSESGSDAESASSDQLENAMSGNNLDADGEWEWCFSLQLEDAVVKPGEEKQKFWAVVNNHSAQLLLGLDASNLARDKEGLDTLREKLFYLWGDLEEHKAREAQRLREAQKAVQRKGRGDRPPADSSDEEDPARGKMEIANGTKGKPVTNRPFSCCVRQYGVAVPERDPGRANVGKGKRWQRVFGLFGTRIVGV